MAPNQSLTLELKPYTQAGTGLSSQFSSKTISSSLDVALHEEVGLNFAGLGVFQASASSGQLPFSELLRVYMRGDGNIEYIMNVPARAYDPRTPNVYYVDPINGSMSNDGSAAAPWRTLEEVFDQGLIETRSAKNTPWVSQSSNVFEPVGGWNLKNAGAPVKSGDIILLRDGYHGSVFYRGAFNDDYITIAAESGHTPVLSKVQISAGYKWRFSGITITPEAAPSYSNGTIFFGERHGWHGPCRNIILENSSLHSVNDTSSWAAADWDSLAARGINMHCPDSIIQQNTLRNVNFGIVLSGERTITTGNTIENIAGDGNGRQRKRPKYYR